MLDVLLDVLFDTIKIIPFLFFAFLLLEYIEHKMSNKNIDKLTKSKKFGPIIGSLLGVIPQCGFSIFCSNLYSSHVITIGTLVAVFLSCSDEMLVVLLSGGITLTSAIKILLVKLFIGLTFGLIIDLIFIRKNKKNLNNEIHDICKEDNCHCEKGILHSSIHHTLEITLFILLVNLVLSLLIHFIGENSISNFISKTGFIKYFLSSIVGLIPNCAASVIITELYVSNIITLGTMIGGLLTSSGMGLLILFRTNKNLKENLLILALVYFIGVFSGFIIDFLGLVL